MSATTICQSCGTENAGEARYCSSCGRPLATTVARTRRAVTTLFCDLVASTELGRKADAETAHHILSRFYDTTRACVLRHGGSLEKFVGDAVMAVFGFPRLHEDDALRAARAALDIARAVDVLSDQLEVEWGIPLEIRTGIATGEVLAGPAAPDEPFVIGSSVNLAARLEQAAAPGQILLDGETSARIRRRAEIRVLPRATLKGFGTDGVPVAELLAIADGTLSTPVALVDRRSELRLLDDALRAAIEQRRCRVVNVVGEAGLGKSRLVDEFGSRNTTVTVLHGRCAATGEASPMRPLAEMVTRAVGSSPDDRLDDIRAAFRAAGTDADDVDRLLATIGVGRAPLATEDRAATLRAFVTQLARRSSGGVAVIVEDAHHATPELLDILRHVAGWTRDAPVLMVCAGRPDMLLHHPAWARAPGAITIGLEPLGADDGAALVASLRPEAGDALRRRIVEIAGGNPFFIEEVVAALPAATDGVGVTDVPVPSTVMSLLDARVDALDDDERTVLERAAVLGTTFRIDEVARLCGRDVADVLARLADRDLVVRDPAGGDLSWRFRQALIRDAAYQAVPKQVRADLHVAVADGTDDDARAGFHLDRATTTLRDLGSRSTAVDELAERAGARLAGAGRDASSRGDVSSAARLLERAVALLPAEHPARPDALADLHHARLYAGDIDGAERAVDELLGMGHGPDDLVTVRATMQRAHLSFLRDPSAMPADGYREQLEAAIPRFEVGNAEGDLAAALTDLALVSWVEGRGGAMAEAAQRALAAAERCGDPRAMQEAAPLLATALLLGPTSLDEVVQRLAALEAVARDDRLTLATLRLTEAQAFALVGRLDDARAALAAARATFEDLGQRRWLAASAETDAVIHLEDDDLDGAIVDRRSAHAFFADQGDALNAGVAAATLADALVRAGDIAGAVSLVAGVDERTSDPEVAVTSMAVRAAIAAARGDGAVAEHLAAEALRIADATDLLLLQADARVTLASGDVDPRGMIRDAIDRYEAKGATGRAARVRASAT